jgi:alginate O-acetyltransferase complex protein AlgI
MNFVSLPFVVLAAVTFVLHYLPVRASYWQVGVLIAASLVFYGWEQPYLLVLLLFSAATTSFASRGIARSGSLAHQRLIAIGGVGAMLLVLAFFKYDRLLAQLVAGDIDAISGPAQRLLALPLPIGISFYTFHGISLVVDTFTGKEPLRAKIPGAEHAARTLLYLTFFPQLIAGPIMKARDFLPQIAHKELRAVDWEAATRALIVGYFLKMVVADNLAVLTEAMTQDVSGTPSITLLMMVFAYSCRIFADFAGYSLIAIGLARLFGYELMTNFNFPYLSQSFAEFWHRWHISLSTWLRDYLYIPLGGSRCGPIRRSVNILIVMFLGGLWHGTTWSYAVWGTAHGIALAIERPFRNTAFYRSSSIALRLLRTALVVSYVSFAWLLFRLPDFSQVEAYVARLLGNWGSITGGEGLLALALYSLPVVIYHLLQLGGAAQALIARPAAKTLVYAALTSAIALNSGVSGAFIYFRF